MAGIVLNGVYNHYLTTYASKEVTQNDTHKKDDLRNTYKSIVKSNQNNPVYLLGQNDHAEAGAIDLKERARMLQDTLTTLSDIGQEKPLGQKTAFSSNGDVVHAHFIGEQDGEAPSFTMKVDALATEQINTGNYLPNSRTALTPGSYAFNIRMNEQVFELQFSINDGDTNLAVQERLSRLINKAGIGLNAEILPDGKGKTALSISSKATGKPVGRDKQFLITEESDGGKKGTVAYFGLDKTSQEPTDARFRINGQTHTSSANRFTISKIYEIQLHRPSQEDEEAVIGVKDEKESLVDHVHSLVDGYNDFLDSVGRISANSFRTGKIHSEIVRVAKEALADTDLPIGLTIGDDGKLMLDESSLEAAHALPEEELDEKLQPVRDFAKSLYTKAKAVALDPMQYVSRPVVAYKNPGHGLPNPYITSEYSGMMFNNYC